TILVARFRKTRLTQRHTLTAPHSYRCPHSLLNLIPTMGPNGGCSRSTPIVPCVRKCCRCSRSCASPIACCKAGLATKWPCIGTPVNSISTKLLTVLVLRSIDRSYFACDRRACWRKPKLHLPSNGARFCFHLLKARWVRCSRGSLAVRSPMCARH